MKTLLVLTAAVVGYVLLEEWLDKQRVDPFWESDAHVNIGADNDHPYPWSAQQ